MNPVLISQNIYYDPLRNQLSDQLDHRWLRLLMSLGLTPLPIPNLEQSTTATLNLIGEIFNLVNPCGVILTGGNDFGLYPSRDLLELAILEFCHINCVPLLGVCRGMQAMAVYAGVPLVSVLNHAGTTHNLQSKHLWVNSFHNFALSTCPPDYDVSDRSPDGVIESIRHHHLPWIGCMWHPERTLQLSPYDSSIFHELFLL